MDLGPSRSRSPGREAPRSARRVGPRRATRRQANMNVTSLELRSEVTPAGQLRLSLDEREVKAPGPDEVVVRVEAAPINPADVAELLGSADVSTLRREPTTDRPVTTAELPPRLV